MHNPNSEISADIFAQTLQIFEKLCAIPRASFKTQKAFDFLLDECKKLGMQTRSDEAKNIYAYFENLDSQNSQSNAVLKNNAPKCCLQGHYDMVAVGEAQKGNGVQIVRKNINGKEFLCAQNSSLGADNGIAIALSLALAGHFKNIELLFTNDEEVGMIGAKNLNLKIRAPLMLNLDSEDINEIVLGCAGGFDVLAKKHLNANQARFKNAYLVRSRGFEGGHSGIDIHKNIKNAIVEFAYAFENLDFDIVRLKAGEKRNSIPVGLEAIILAQDLSAFENDYFEIQNLDSQNVDFCFCSREVLSVIFALHSGVYGVDMGSVINSLNISQMCLDSENLQLNLMARANDDALMHRMQTHLRVVLEAFGFSVEFADFYSAWKRSIEYDDEILRSLSSLYEKQGIKPHMAQIHAGLECGILQGKLDCKNSESKLKIISIGPTIDFPHSINERLDLQSVKILTSVLVDFLKD